MYDRHVMYVTYLRTFVPIFSFMNQIFILRPLDFINLVILVNIHFHSIPVNKLSQEIMLKCSIFKSQLRTFFLECLKLIQLTERQQKKF